MVQTPAKGMDARSEPAWKIRKLRGNRGLSRERLAVDAGIDRANVSQMERGTEAASIDTMERLAAALGVGMAALIELPAADAERPKNMRKGRKPC